MNLCDNKVKLADSVITLAALALVAYLAYLAHDYMCLVRIIGAEEVTQIEP
jgi:hypothetical protein